MNIIDEAMKKVVPFVELHDISCCECGRMDDMERRYKDGIKAAIEYIVEEIVKAIGPTKWHVPSTWSVRRRIASEIRKLIGGAR